MHWRRDSPAACGENHGKAACTPAAHEGPHAAAAGSALKEAAAHGKPMPEQAPGRSYGWWRGAHTEPVCF